MPRLRPRAHEICGDSAHRSLYVLEILMAHAGYFFEFTINISPLNSYHQLNLVFSFLELDLLVLPDQVFPQVPHFNSLPTVLTFLLPQVGHLFFLAISTPTFARARSGCNLTFRPSSRLYECLASRMDYLKAVCASRRTRDSNILAGLLFPDFPKGFIND